MKLYSIIYIVSISLQLDGAIILLLSFFGNTNKLLKDILEIKGQAAVLDGRAIKDIDIKDDLRDIYLNRTAFVCLIIGYLLAIWGDLGNTAKFHAFLGIVITCACSVLFIYSCCKLLAFLRADKVRDEYFKNKKPQRKNNPGRG